jgi:hypothetical protein
VVKVFLVHVHPHTAGMKNHQTYSEDTDRKIHRIAMYLLALNRKIGSKIA